MLHWSIGDVSEEEDAERLIILYMDSIEKKWNPESKTWIDKPEIKRKKRK